MKFLVDAQLPPALATFLRSHGHEAVHVYDLAMAAVDDAVIWEEAARSGATIITKDEDFASRTIVAAQGVSVVWVRIGNCSNRALLQWFAPLLVGIVTRLQVGERLIEVN